jgi:hypothetical protein
MVQSFATLFPAARHFAYGCMSGRPLATLRENRARRWCVFTSAGDHNNVLSWLAGLDGREWDLVVAFYGDDDAAFERLRPACRAAFRSKGSKFQNLKKLFNSEPQLFEQYDFIWIADDDLTIRPEDVAQLFRYAAEYGFWISQPAFSSEGANIPQDHGARRPRFLHSHRQFRGAHLPSLQNGQAEGVPVDL